MFKGCGVLSRPSRRLSGHSRKLPRKRPGTQAAYCRVFKCQTRKCGGPAFLLRVSRSCERGCTSAKPSSPPFSASRALLSRNGRAGAASRGARTGRPCWPCVRWARTTPGGCWKARGCASGLLARGAAADADALPLPQVRPGSGPIALHAAGAHGKNLLWTSSRSSRAPTLSDRALLRSTSSARRMPMIATSTNGFDRT